MLPGFADLSTMEPAFDNEHIPTSSKVLDVRGVRGLHPAGESRCPVCVPQARASTPNLKDAIDPEALALERFEPRPFPRHDIVLTQVLLTVSSGRITS